MGQPNVQVFPAFDSTDSKIKVQNHDLGKPIGELGTIKVPEFLQGQAFLNFLRLKRADLLMTQIACFLSHFVSCYLYNIAKNKFSIFTIFLTRKRSFISLVCFSMFFVSNNLTGLKLIE